MIAPSVPDAVAAAGGWLFDRALAGWDVLALVADLPDPRPMQILGVRTADMERGLTSPVPGPKPHTLAADARLYETDERVRQIVLRAVQQRLTEVLLWGADEPEDLVGELDPVTHRLSVAARAFKAEALLAAGAARGPVEDSERFHGGALAHAGDFRPSFADAGDLLPTA